MSTSLPNKRQPAQPTSAVTDFSTFNLEPSLLPLLEAAGWRQPTPIQSATLAQALEGQDLIALAQTGSGKTLAYALSVLTHLARTPGARALVLSPSRETAEQVYHVFSQLCSADPQALALIVTGTPLRTQDSLLKKNPRVVVATPGRLQELLVNNKLFLAGLQILVLDEADRMVELGFEKQLRFIHSTLRGRWQTLCFAASLSPKARDLARALIQTPTSTPLEIATLGAGKPVLSLQQKVLFLSNAQKTFRLLDEMRKIKGGTIIFADSQESCVKVGRLFAHHQISADFVHGDMKPGHRTRVLREFRQQKIQVLITTDLLARGLDVPHVQNIINFDLPYKAEDFLHRIGRTARAGRSGTALTFVTPADGRAYRKMKTYLEGAEEEIVMAKFEFLDRHSKD